MSFFTSSLTHLIQANVPVIQIVSFETLRIHAEIIQANENLPTPQPLYKWDRVAGLYQWDNDEKCFESKDEDLTCPNEILDFFKEQDNCILLLEDFYPDLSESKPSIVRQIRNFAINQAPNKTLIFSQPFPCLPKELEKEVHLLHLDYPTEKDLEQIYYRVCQKFNLDTNIPNNELIQSALGLTIMEAEKAFSLAYIENKSLSNSEVPLIIREKENIIKKSGYLEYYHPKETIQDVGGLSKLKDWLKTRGFAFNKGAKDFGLDYPRGILLLGIPGTGKSLTAKAVGNLWNFPLLRLDMGKIFGGIVGESEHNIREALNIAETIAPSILWIDEIEKGLSGLSSSGSSDGGTTSRVLGTFLTWMQEKSKPVFVVATANDISQLPPELLRKGRVDEIFFVDLPTKNEREEIIKIHLSKKKRNSDDFDIATIAEKSIGFSGAELAEVVKEALFQAYDDEKELNNQHILNAIDKTYPLSQTMRETISQMRKWAKSRAVLASNDTAEELPQNGKDTPKLKQETYNNPFVSK
ncbi:AAA family ATPase [Pasteurella skyensis]|uniref:Uncharacterized AAA domain-containing protein ycf46 n=1 Tax=Phocoenobacter skyensis TaxID=97481 RepID=A0AAJ6N8T0_9PAST|nr:AAA family ATPase [Pasteurella skyensis]MDP8162364.1 AAA family ATPase [Pasteurella skyensis]MDP8172302.1 AAA family ATPase [Pasteurella skyensis]MDP8178557.1 AAA family ATPase [Pasteurella skyensis]MDP8182559.1 AAA family ATPase [Pasteurella skyensis]MDP8188864.1 AAA family ATPase [Pasteurella skyensis]